MKQKLLNTLVIIVVIIVATGVFSGVFFLTDWIFKSTGQQPSPLVTYVINTVMGLISCFLILLAIGLFFSKKRDQQMGFFGVVLEALGKIAKGDFSVRLDSNFEDNLGFFSELAKGVNNMAVELDQMEQMRQEFISNVSHEIQSPLTSIRGFAKALQNEQLSPTDRAHYLGIIEAESNRLSNLTDNLLKLASLEADQVKFEPKPYRLDKQLRNVILSCEPQWSSKSLEMDVSLEEITVTADEDLLSQVWLNLIHNSIKFTPQNGKICVSLCQRDSNIEFTIQDTGIGISADDQAHIFERFYKADKSRTHATNGGSGLGLAIAQKIVELHQGVITVQSKSGEGTTFTVALAYNNPSGHSPV